MPDDDHTCDECGQEFATDRGLQIHIGKQHRDRCAWSDCETLGEVEFFENWPAQEPEPHWITYCHRHALTVAYATGRELTASEILAWRCEGEEIPPIGDEVEDWPSFQIEGMEDDRDD